MIFITDSITGLKESLGLPYADDFKLFKSIQNEEDCEKLTEFYYYLIRVEKNEYCQVFGCNF